MDDYYRLVVDFWRMFRKCQALNWDEIADAGRKFVKDHGDTRFAKDLVLAMHRELDGKER